MQHRKPQPQKRSRERSGRRRPGSKFRVRLPRDYPWLVLQHLIVLLKPLHPSLDFTDIEGIVRSRDYQELLRWAACWDMQRISRQGEGVNVHDARAILMLGSLIRKYRFPADRIGRREKAIANIYLGESQCKEFNCSGHKRLEGSLFLQTMRIFIAKVLGDVLPCWEELTLSSRHGPGSSTATCKGRNSKYFKYSEWPYHVTHDAARYARQLIESDHRWLGALEDSYRRRFSIPPWAILNLDRFWSETLEIVPGNRITTVPKDSLKDRPIAIEPTMNLMLQLGVDGYIRKRLKRWNIDLDHQDRNQYLAFLGSVDRSNRSPCTIDLANASDTISLRLVKMILPEPWYDYVVAIRSHTGLLPNGERLRYRKLSSMGNGATFAIESLVFAAVAYATQRTLLGSYDRDYSSVFGDDIIVPEKVALITARMLEACGFSINRDKSFLTGLVKESCGSDWIRGTAVRPVFFTELPGTVSQLYSDRNRLCRWMYHHIGDASFEDIDKLYLKWIPKQLRLFGPISDEEFDTYLHSDSKPNIDPDGRYRWRAVSVIPRRSGGREFLFRKLMAPLSVGPEKMQFSKLHLSKGRKKGSTFDVIPRNAERLCIIKRQAWLWPTSYRPIRPVSPLK